MSREERTDGVDVTCDEPGCDATVRFNANDDDLVKERAEELGWAITSDDKCPDHKV